MTEADLKEVEEQHAHGELSWRQVQLTIEYALEVQAEVRRLKAELEWLQSILPPEPTRAD